MPRWIIGAIAVFWVGFLLTGVVQAAWGRLSNLLVVLMVSLFVALAIEPGVNRLAARGWKRGAATGLILLGIFLAAAIFVGAIGTVIGTQIADLLQNSDRYIQDTVNRINDLFNTSLSAQGVIDEFTRPDGRIQNFIRSQQDNAVRLSMTALGMAGQLLSVLLFAFYMTADGPRMRRAVCSRLRPDRQHQVLAAWDIAVAKTGGYLYSRALLAAVAAFSHWVAFQAMGIKAPIPLALWVGATSQFLPVIGTYLAGIFPVLITLLDSPTKAILVIVFLVVYQQVENLVLTPRITARAMELHPAIAFGSALAGFALLGGVGAVLALPFAALVQAVVGEWGERHEVVDSTLLDIASRDDTG